MANESHFVPMTPAVLINLFQSPLEDTFRSHYFRRVHVTPQGVTPITAEN